MHQSVCLCGSIRHIDLVNQVRSISLSVLFTAEAEGCRHKSAVCVHPQQTDRVYARQPDWGGGVTGRAT